MTKREKQITLVDVPDPGKLEEHGISIDAPTPTQFVMPNPWGLPSETPANGQPQVTQPDPTPGEPTDR